MPAVALLVFREVMEAALIVSIVCAATRGVLHRGRYVSAGILLGVVGALGVALGASFLARLVQGTGQEIFNATVLLTAVMMIGWHVMWLARHGRELAQRMGDLGNAVQAGTRSLTWLLVVVALAVLREGSEIVLFLSSMALSGLGAGALIGGVALGVGSGAGLGIGMYVGLLRIPMKHYFTVTNAMLVVLAAGLASKASSFLIQGNLLPTWGDQLWNTSRWLSNGSFTGQTLNILIGYDARPTGMQLVFYVTALILLFVGMWHRGLIFAIQKLCRK